MNYANFWLRSVAHLIDFILVNGLELLIEQGLKEATDMSSFTQQMIGVVLSLVFTYWYYCRYQVRTGTTFGKRIFGIYVVDEKTGQNMTHKQALIRMSGYVVSYVVIGCGFLMAAFHPQRKALHDLFAGTVSIKRER
jgi:uncharacterized RDD family membrane protein YckC